MTSVCHLASRQAGLDTRVALDARMLRAAAGFDRHSVITAIEPDVTKVACSGVTVHTPQDQLVRAGELAAILNQLAV